MSRELLLKNVRLAWQTEAFSVRVKGGRVSEISDRQTPSVADEIFDLDGMLVLPSFIDIHNHGAVGIDVNEADVEGLYKVSQFLASQGVAAWLPTIVPDSSENYTKIIEAVEKLMSFQQNEPIAQILGVHYEGVFANQQMCGALRPQFFKTFHGSELEDLPTPAKGVYLMTLAPEVEGGIELVKELQKRGWIVSIGHTKADVATLEQAFEAGARHLTHFFNAMTGIHHREIGVAGWGLTNSDVTFDIIADKIHVHPKMLKFACSTKGAEKVSLISDSVAPTGLGDGTYNLWGEKISIKQGRTQNERGSIAGSVITMLDAVRNMLTIGFSFEEVAKMVSENPAKLLHLEKDYGSLEVGKFANLVALNENFEIVLAFVHGQKIEV